MDCLASMYIDNELTLEEKVQFIKRIHEDAPFYEDARSLLLQEKLLRAVPAPRMVPCPPRMPAAYENWVYRLLRPAIYATAGFALAMMVLFSRAVDPVAAPTVNRFVIYEPTAQQVELMGSFTDWQKVSMIPVGASGYWERRLALPSGEHRFAYILDGRRQMADPTLPVREKDDFGGENSILKIEAEAKL